MKVTRNLLVVLMLLLFCNSAKSISVSEIVKVGRISYKVTSVNKPGGYFNADVYEFDDFDNYSGDVTIPRLITYDGLTGVVSGIFRSAFYKVDITKVSIPELVSVIDGGAFYCCHNLRTVVFDGTSSLKRIGYQAFEYCRTLKTFEIPNSVTTIEQGAFAHCDSLTSVTIPSSVQSFGLNTSTSTEAVPVFYYTHGLKAIYVLNPEPIDISEMEFEFKNANNVTIWSIARRVTLYVPRGSKEKYAAAKGWNVFTNIVELGLDISDEHVKSICLDKWDTNKDGIFTEEEAAAVTSIGDTFKNNTDIVSLDVLQYFTGLDSISRYAFYGCTNLASVIIPESVDSIFPHAFRDCPSLTSLNIPANVKYINDSAIRNTGITELTVDENNTIYDSRNNCNAVIETSTNTLIVGCNSTVIPDNVVTIGAKAFHSNSFITTIDLPNSVTSIQNDVFNGCTALTEIIIPSGVTDIGSNAFKGCTNLASVTSLATTPPVAGTDAFNKINADATLYVPKGSKSAYESALGWDLFTNIVETGDDVQEPEPDPEPDPEPNDDTDISAMEDVLYIINSEGFVGSSVTLSLNLKHAMDVSAFQANLFLPEGLEIEKITRGDELKVQDDNEEYIYTFNNSKQEDGSRFLLCYSVSNTPMTVGDINVAKITIKIPEGTAAGSYPIILKNVEMSYGSENKLIDYVKSTLIVNDYLPGDANGDSRISVTDISSIASYLLGTTPSAFVEKAADANGDSRVSVTDISSIAAKLLGGSSNAKTVHIEFDE